MDKIKRPAIKLLQGRRVLFLSSFLVRDFMSDGFYRIDRLDVEAGEGMQRLLNEARAKRFGRDMNSADEYNEAFLPTSVFLATAGTIDYDESARALSTRRRLLIISSEFFWREGILCRRSRIMIGG